MSRNLGYTDCKFCDHEVVLTEEPRPITKEEAFVYFDEFATMLVANAECPMCLAKYLAWVKRPSQGIHASSRYGESWGDEPFGDLSFRSTFNDEPGPDDLPTFAVKKEVIWTRTGPYAPIPTPG